MMGRLKATSLCLVPISISISIYLYIYMACKRCEISTFIKDNGVDLFFVTETWLSAQGDEAKTVELAPSGFDVKSFPR